MVATSETTTSKISSCGWSSWAVSQEQVSLGAGRTRVGRVITGILSRLFSTGSRLAPLCPGSRHRCISGECAPKGGPCDGAVDCEDGSDEEGCGPLRESTTSRYGLALGWT